MKKHIYAVAILVGIGITLYCGYQWGVFAYSILFIFIIFLSWFLHGEIGKTIHKDEHTEKELRKERDQLENEVRKKTDELKQSELNRMYELGKVAEFGRLAQGLFHDLLSPLSGLALHMEKVKSLTSEELKHSYVSLENISLTSKKMTETLERLRETMSQSMPPRECDVKTEILHVTEILKFKTQENEVSISLEEDAPLTWYGDPIRFHQIFSNLISNAIDACEGVVGRERLITIQIGKKDGRGFVEIKDNGLGMTEEILSQIFTPYFTTKTPEKGSGVGLTIVQKILKEIGGTLLVESTPNVGSTFTVLL